MSTYIICFLSLLNVHTIFDVCVLNKVCFAFVFLVTVPVFWVTLLSSIHLYFLSFTLLYVCFFKCFVIKNLNNYIPLVCFPILDNWFFNSCKTESLLFFCWFSKTTKVFIKIRFIKHKTNKGSEQNNLKKRKRNSNYYRSRYLQTPLI